MKKNILILTTALSALGFLGATTQTKPAQASAHYYWVKSINRNNLPYHAASQRSAYIYNTTHTQKLHNLKNYPRTTWYVSKSIIMRSSYTGKKGIYYYVTNGTGKVSGVVWRGYLTSGTNPNGGTTPSDNDNGNSDNNNGTDTNPTNSLRQELAGFFEGTVPDSQLQQIANEYPSFVSKYSNPDSGDEYFQIMVANKYKDTQQYMTFFFIGNSGKNNKEKQQQLKSGQISFKNYVNNVVYAANGNVSFTTFKNRLIGAYAFDKSSPNYGRGVVILEYPKQDQKSSN
ncbi:hypothetical protein [Lentilactobacillus kefiri]|uniref:D-alanyl-D-alanine carboxypeptidase n=2 Tax=Lentilactobacillus kefiri TaxID=33962 RepID=A0A8E1RJ01_LENKE|nr:hypothetical protein [Lentilactobacillus kefiri]KRL57564.1 hypothetical protein FD08_GL003978 [Lentilactobacillus parakefiri DSM 10551]KRM52496.1 hypothetical protein FC95_GL001214 [Lentilactobacillus kefiri DSM 20587 = JCM 5818]MCP9370013.1 hypothetical protein [Lentilactobacillus kefiri]MDH5109353.1 hypothetical protein [Lentilactobacillus kefiri]PAK58640.1 hypothetical protein B9K02_10490 [Lentilactobacillus kefiri]